MRYLLSMILASALVALSVVAVAEQINNPYYQYSYSGLAAAQQSVLVNHRRR
jgi:hypothetical protein